MAFWFAGLYQDWLSGIDALIIGAAVAAIAPIGDLFASMVKRDLGRKDTGKPLRPARRPPRPPRRGLLHDRRRLLPLGAVCVLRPVPAGVPLNFFRRQLSAVRGRHCEKSTRRSTPTGTGLTLCSTAMKKLVILGSTGSIGTQALEIVAGSEELQVVGLAAGSSWERVLEQARQHGVPTVALGDARRRRAGAFGLERARAGRRGGHPRVDRLVGRRPGAERDGRRRRPGSDRGRAQRGDRRRACQQGEPGGRRRADDGAGRGRPGRGCCRSTPSTRRSSS